MKVNGSNVVPQIIFFYGQLKKVTLLEHYEGEKMTI